MLVPTCVIVSLTDVDTVDCASSQTVKEGSKISLRCSAKTDALSRPNIRWEKDGMPLNGSASGVLISQNGSESVLTIEGSNRWYAGKYKCVAVNNNSKAEDACPEALVVVDCKYSAQVESSSVGMGRRL